MTYITRWSPANDLMRNRFHRLFDQSLSDFFSPISTEEVSEGTWTPPVDIRETDDGLTLLAELPGLTKDAVSIAIEDHVLTLSGERSFEKETKEENYHRIERAYGSFARSFTLPRNVSTEEVVATFENGVLKVELPKTEEAKPKKIEIK